MAAMPEREAMSHLSHNSRAVHRAYVRLARNVTLPLEFYEQQKRDKLVKFQAAETVKSTPIKQGA